MEVVTQLIVNEVIIFLKKVIYSPFNVRSSTMEAAYFLLLMYPKNSVLVASSLNLP